jgi:hypothetical protein
LYVHQAHEVRQGRAGEGGGRAEETGSQVRLLQHNHNKSVRKVPNQLFLQRRVSEVCVEEAQEDVQGADEGDGE